MTSSRQPKGVPVGGQFTPDTHTEPDVSLNFDRGDRIAAAESSAQAHEWVAGQASHHLSPVIGWIRRDAANGKDTSGHLTSFHERVGRLADDVVERFTTPQSLQERADATNIASEAIWKHLQPVFSELRTAADDDSRLTTTRWRVATEAAAEEIAKKVTAPAPVLNGFTAAQVEEHMAKAEHQRQCGCVLKDDICATREYGENWRWRMGVPNVEGMFDALQEMAAERGAKEHQESNA